jgi:hypothetical protein
MKRVCWFKDLPDAGPCDGRLVRCHLIRRQVLRHELNASRAVMDDPRGWVWGCGGITGAAGHHGAADWAGPGKLEIPHERLPVEFLAWVDELGLGWWIDRTYRRSVNA